MGGVHVLAPATSARAKCRACGHVIGKGELRFGERVPNPFGEGEATYWFHLLCAACRRPEPVMEALGTTEVAIQDHHRLEALAAEGIALPRLPRLAGVERDRAGRARCRHCRSTFEKGEWRIVLQIWEDGRFGAMGFAHVRCARAYFGGGELLFRLCLLTPTLSDPDVSEIDELLRGVPPAAAPAREDA